MVVVVRETVVVTQVVEVMVVVVRETVVVT